MRPIDLTLTISESLPVFPGSPGPQFIPWSSIREDGYNLEMLFLSSHTGTHLDAPYHFAARGAKVDRIPLGRLVGEAVLVRLGGKGGVGRRKGRNARITRADIVAFERAAGAKIPDGSSVFFFTGWQENLGKPNYFSENPGLDGSAARYLVSKRANLVGIDSPSIDPGPARSFRAHRTFAENDVLIVENLANLGRITGDRFRFAVLPLKLRNATGSPVRAVAF